MDSRNPRRVLGLVPDLFFATRIAAVAKQEGVDWTPVPPQLATAHPVDRAPDLVVVDLHGAGAIEAVAALKRDDARRGWPVLGFYSHVDTATRDAALAAGAEQVLPRSAFTRRLSDLLAGREAPRLEERS